MLIAIESLVSLFERLLTEFPFRRSAAQTHADNDNEDAGELDRRWSAYRRHG